jgi:hypothetical protein
MAEMVKPQVASGDTAAPTVGAASVTALPADVAIPVVKVGDRVLYVRSSEPLSPNPPPRVAIVTKVHGTSRPGRINLVYFQAEKGEDPVMFEEDVLYSADVRWPGRWSVLPE